jgi:hypothetical protein
MRLSEAKIAELRATAERGIGSRFSTTRSHAKTILSLLDEVEALRKALKPFSECASEHFWPSPEDNLTVSCRVHVLPAYEVVLGTSDFRAARRALSDQTEAPE